MLKAVLRYSSVLLLLTIFSCKQKSSFDEKNALFQLLTKEQTGIDFNNKVADDTEFNVFNYRNFYNGAGVAIGDLDNDGKPDIVFTANQGLNKVYINKGNLKFEDITAKSGLNVYKRWHTGVAIADVNGDGWLDIYISNSGGLKDADRANELYINQKNGTFKEEAVQYGLADKGLSTQALFFDYDHDGDLDCFVLNNSYRPIGSFGYERDQRTKRDPQNGDRLYRNDGGRFTDVSEEANIYGSEIGFGLGIAAADLFNSGWDDLYISNDFFEHDYLYRNLHNGKFQEISDEAVRHMSLSSMGSDVADINNDGYPDIFTTDMLPENDYRLKTTTKFDEYDIYNAKLKNTFHHQFTTNCLQLNNGDGTFSEIANLSGINATDWSWGALSFDFNNDGWKDLFVNNGISRDLTNQDFLTYFSSTEVMNEVQHDGFKPKKLLDLMPKTPIPSYGFINQKNLTFKNESEKLGFFRPAYSNGAAYGDLDGDGDIDLVVNNENMEAFVYRNMTTERSHKNYLKVELKGSGLNTFGVGAKVTVYVNGNAQLIEQMPTRGFESSSDPVMNFGVGNAKNIDSVKVVWTDFKMQLLKNVKPNTKLVLKQSEANGKFRPYTKPQKPLYNNVTKQQISGDIFHKENDYKDFDEQRLIPKMLSTEGPKLAVADVNGDKLDDFFVGGATGDTAKLFIQQPDGRFIQKKIAAFEQDRICEDIGAQFFDADHDGDMDLVVVSGGNQSQGDAISKLSRLYINDGKGNFTRKFSGWPLISMNASCVRVNDKTGDVFIGGRSTPGAYGMPASSKLLHNDGHGNFTDVSTSVGSQLQNLGMVTDAQWIDIDGNGQFSLAIVGDWMPLTIFKYQGDKLVKATEVNNSSGWWNCLTVADVNADGKPDLVAGNRGLNSKIQADAIHPAKLYVSDFDNNGQVECIPVYYKTDGKAYPFNLHDDLIKQLPYLKKKILRYDAYAGKSIEDVFTAEELAKAKLLTVTQTQTCAFINKGKGQFTMQALPVMAQLSEVFSILQTDVNKDGINDLFMGGNFFGLKPEVGRYDASYGVTFLGTKNKGFNYMTPAQSGMSITGEIRDIKTISTKKGKQIIIARNNDSLQIFGSN
ncbi:VCBS repeat-containing protein [Mucilaginibacter ginkgonis]|uniref:VCBS repeat-containing protein n=1 Tax=Mucilaginibacter ginkgonis TaxID=2682091 RepID=A0A6I4I1V3_9SPHI|nr:VCBS repeat-containing protein [Mucilaginibacter ginkgonis]QQL51467.1 VCBS repeat-containing protein [Mucilaginibacter ginkgonis]